MSSDRGVALVLTVDQADGFSDYDGHEIRVGGELVGYRPYDGSGKDEISDEVVQTLAFILRERLGWKASR